MISSKAVRNALAAHLRTRLSLGTDAVLPDWPPATKELARPVAVTVIDAGPVAHDGETGAPELVSMTPGAGATATARYRLGSFTIPLAIELWCATEFERDRRIEQIQAALNEAPTVSGEAVADVLAGLTLTVADYFNAPCTFDSDGWLATPQAEGVTREEWRATFPVTARIDELVEKTVTRQVATEVTVTASPDPLS